MSDPIYALSDIFRFSAHSENQFLNMVKLHISRETAGETSNGHALDNLRYTKNLIDHHSTRIHQAVLFLRSRELLEWPRTQDPVCSAVAAKDIRLLLSDFGYLGERAEMLSRACDQGIDSVINQSVFEVSVKGLENAHDVQRLTVLATMFIPMAFTASLFGMNFKELQDLSIWVFFATAVVVVILAAIGFYWRPSFLQKSDNNTKSTDAVS